MSAEIFTISRTFKAPRGTVFDAFSKAESLSQWWGTKGVKIVNVTLDFRPGGLFHYGMQMSDGSIVWGSQAYVDIIRPERIELINSFSDAAGGLSRAPFADKWPLEMHTQFLFEEVSIGTKFTVIWKPHNSDAEEKAVFAAGMASMNGGWTGTLDQLEEFLAKA